MLVLCPWCDGKKEYLMNGDLHRSSGIVPCHHCDENGNYDKPEESFILQIKKTPQEVYEEEYLKWLLVP